MRIFFLALLIFVPLALTASFSGVPGVAVFFLSALGIVPLAKYIGEATEELASRANPALGGFLSATFGNATELIIGLFALHAGLFELVKASITGSIIGNLLLVTGLAMLAGGWKHASQRFNQTAVLASGSTLFLAVVALIIPAFFLQTAPSVPAPILENLSVFVAVILIMVYAASLFFSLHTHKHLYTEEARFMPRWSAARALAVLALATVFVAWLSDILVGSVEPLVASLGWSELFIGVIVVAIIGNAAEHASAITTALKNRMDLSLQITTSSATQIAMFVAPVLVGASVFFGSPMSLVFNPFELVAIVLSVLIVNLVIVDGESNWLEGVQLGAAYAIIAVAFFFHP